MSVLTNLCNKTSLNLRTRGSFIMRASCCLKYLRSSSSTRTKFKKYLRKRFVKPLRCWSVGHPESSREISIKCHYLIIKHKTMNVPDIKYHIMKTIIFIIIYNCIYCIQDHDPPIHPACKKVSTTPRGGRDSTIFPNRV